MGAIYNKVASQGVSMKSGLEGRNNVGLTAFFTAKGALVSMKSGLEGRNNGDGSQCLL